MKHGEGVNADHKENFDVIRTRAHLLAGVTNPSSIAFVNNAMGLVDLVKPLIINFAKSVEREFGLKGFADEVDGRDGIIYIRLIHYFGNRGIGDEIAAAHADKSGFTLHLFESDPGLQCLPFNNVDNWEDMHVSDGETVIIPGMQLQLRSECKLRALAHRVVATQETAQTGRYSAVCFVSLPNTPIIDTDKRGRLQELVPGFNYGILLDELRTFFK